MVKGSCNNVPFGGVHRCVGAGWCSHESVTGVPSLLCCSVSIVKWTKMLSKLLIIRDDNLQTS